MISSAIAALAIPAGFKRSAAEAGGSVGVGMAATVAALALGGPSNAAITEVRFGTAPSKSAPLYRQVGVAYEGTYFSRGVEIRNRPLCATPVGTMLRVRKICNRSRTHPSRDHRSSINLNSKQQRAR